MKLFERAKEEQEYVNVYKSGDVESKVSQFETIAQQKPKTDDESTKEDYSELEERYAFEPAPTFSWSKRFESSLPNPADNYTTARKHVQLTHHARAHRFD